MTKRRSSRKTKLSEEIREPATPAFARRDARAKLFRNGSSQAVRLPKEFRFSGSEVMIRREGRCVVLEPIAAVPCDANGWPLGFWEEIRRTAAALPDDWRCPDDPVPEPIPPLDQDE